MESSGEPVAEEMFETHRTIFTIVHEERFSKP
jgi:hypothetical protein